MVPWLRTFTWFAVATAGAIAEPERTFVTVLGTTDLHGHIHPVDYYTGETTQDGLAKIGTLVQQARLLDPELLLVDCGDTIQGTPLAYYHARIDNEPRDPMMEVMNALGYDALAIGNHEYNFGLEVLNKARREARFPWISANITLTGSTDSAYSPYIIKNVRGVRVGVLGLTTPGVPSWEERAHYEGLDFIDPVAAAKRWVAELRRRNRVDIVIIAMHMGLEEDLTTGVTYPGQVERENAAAAIAREVPGVDAILMGHTHRTIPAVTINGVLLTQAGRWGDHLARVTLYLDRAEPGDPWRVVGKTATVHPVTADIPPDPAILTLTQETHDATLAWLDEPIGEIDEALTAENSRYEDTAIIDLIQRVQLDVTGADVSLTASFNPSARLPAGQLSVRDIAGLYIYENTLVVVELTGAELKSALEHAATYFGPARLDARTAADLVDPRVPGYNFDIAEGVDYVIDLSRPRGERIVDLTFAGQPLAPERTLRVALNNYRQSGGGGYTMLRDAPVVARYSEGLRDLIIKWVQEHPDAIPTEPSDNWSIRLP